MSRIHEDWSAVVRRAYADLQSFGLPHVNLLIMGRDEAVQAFLGLLAPKLREPITTWLPGQPLRLPPPSSRGTLILRHVHALPPDDQDVLNAWLEHQRRQTQVVSTARTTLVPRIRAGAFMGSLHYRLNTVTIDLSE